MKNQIFKVLSLLLVLTLLVTTCMHSAWSVAAADNNVDYSTGDKLSNGVISPALIMGGINGNSATTIDNLWTTTADKRYITANIYLRADIASIVVPAGCRVYAQFFKTDGVWQGGSGWKEATTSATEYTSTQLGYAGSKYVAFVFATIGDTAFPTEVQQNAFKINLTDNAKTNGYTIIPALTKHSISNGKPITNPFDGSTNVRYTTTYNFKVAEVEKIKIPATSSSDKQRWIAVVGYNAEGNPVSNSSWITTTNSDSTVNIQTLKTETKSDGTYKLTDDAVYLKVQIVDFYKNDGEASKTEKTLSSRAGFEFTIKQTETEPEPPDYSKYIYDFNGQGLKNTFAKLNNDENITIAYMGGSITVGSGIDTELRDTKSWRGLVGTWFTQNFGTDKITNFRAAYGETGSTFGLYRFESEVLPQKPDLIFLEFSVNDFIDKYNSASNEYPITFDDVAKNFESLVRKIRIKLPDSDIVTVITTCKDTFAQGMHNSTAKAHYDISQRYGIPVIDAGGLLEEICNYDFTKANTYMSDNYHPLEKGYELYADVIIKFLAEQEEKHTSNTKSTTHTLPDKLNTGDLFEDSISFYKATLNAEYLTTNQFISGGALVQGALSDSIFNGGLKNAVNANVGTSKSDDTWYMEFTFTGNEVALAHTKGQTQNFICVLDDDENTKKIFQKDNSASAGAYNNGKVEPWILYTGLENEEHTITIYPQELENFRPVGFFVVDDGTYVEPEPDPEPETPSEPVEEVFEYGRLDSTGKPTDNDNKNYIRTSKFHEISKYQSVEIKQGLQMQVFIYKQEADGSYKLIAQTNSIDALYTTDAMKTFAGNEATHFKVCIKHAPDNKEFAADKGVLIQPTESEVNFILKDAQDKPLGTYYVSKDSGAGADGTKEKPLPSIDAAVKKANIRYGETSGTVTINLLNDTPWHDANSGIIERHKFKILIQTEEGNPHTITGIENRDMQMGGDVEFKNVNIATKQYGIIFHNNYNCTYNDDVRFVDAKGNETNQGEISLGVYASDSPNGAYQTKIFDRDVKAEIKIPVYKIYLSNYRGPSMIEGDMHIHYNCVVDDKPAGNPIFVLNSREAGNTSVTYHSGVDMIIDNAEKVSFEGSNQIVFGRNGFLQVLNNASKPTTDNTNAVIPIDSKLALDNASSVWIVHNELKDKTRVGFTGHRGIYTIKDTAKVYAFKDTEQITESYNAQINMGTFGAGIYTLKEEGKASIPTYYPSDEDNTIAKIIEKAAKDYESNHSTEKFTEIKIDISNVTDGIAFGTFSDDFKSKNSDGHKFKVIVTAEAGLNPTVEFAQATTFMGDMKFNNVILGFDTADSEIYLDGNDIEVTETCKIDENLICIFTASGTMSETYDETQWVILDARYGMTNQSVYIGSDKSKCSTTYDADLNIVIGNAASRPTITLSRRDAKTTYNGDLNINAKRFSKLTINYVIDYEENGVLQGGGVVKGENSKVQIIHDDVPYSNENDKQSGVHWTLTEKPKSENQTHLGNNYKHEKIDGGNFVDYHITDKSFDTGCIDCTKTAGVYSSNTEFIISAYQGNKAEGTPIESKDDVLDLTKTLNPTGEWTLTTENYFEDFKAVTNDEFTQVWNVNDLGKVLKNSEVKINDKAYKFTQTFGGYSLTNEKVYVTSSNYLVNNKSIITNKNIQSRDQYISIDFDSSDLDETGSRYTNLAYNTKDNARDHGAGVAIYARLDLEKKQGYELKVYKNRIILTKKGKANANNVNSSGVEYTPVYLVRNQYVTKTAYDAATSDKEIRYVINKDSCDFDLTELMSYTKYNRFPESFDEGNSITFNDTHTYRLGLSVVDGVDGEGETVAYVRILLLDVTTNTLVVDETFKDLNPEGFGGNNFGFGLYGGNQFEKEENSPEYKDDRVCHAYFDNVWFSTKRFRGGDVAEFNDINYDSYFDIRDLVRTYEYMGGANARINFNAADRDYNGFITTSDESEIRKEILHDGNTEFTIKGQIEDEAKVLKDKILNVGVSSGSGVNNGKYYPDLNDENSAIPYTGNAYYVSDEAKEPEDLPVGTLVTQYWEIGGINNMGVSNDNDNNKKARTIYFLKITDALSAKVNSSTQLQCFLYDKDFNFIARTKSENGAEFTKQNLLNGNGKLSFESGASSLSIIHIPKDSNALAKAAESAVYVKFKIERTDRKIESGDITVSNATISGYDYYKDKPDANDNPSGSEKNPWTFRQFQLYGNALPLPVGEKPDRIDPLCVIKENDVVMFKRGDEFTNIEHLKVISLENQATASYTAFFTQSDVIYGAYGEGAKPMLNASAQNYAEFKLCPYCQSNPMTCFANNYDGTQDLDQEQKKILEKCWHNVPNKKHIYWVDVSDVTAYTDLRDNSVLNVIFNDGAKIGVRKFFTKDLYNLYKDGQYTTDIENGKLYLYNQYFGDDNPIAPNEKYNKINLTRCMYGAHGHRGNSNYTIDNINFHGFGSGAFKGSGKSKNIKIQNCEIGFSGGMMYASDMVTFISNEEIRELGEKLADTNTTTAEDARDTLTKRVPVRYGLRYGNGVEMWQSSEQFEIRNCYIYHTFDSAVSPQGDGDSTGMYNGFKVVGNLFEYNNADIEYFDDIAADGNIEDDGTHHTIFTNVEIKENIFRFTSFGWGTRESDKVRGIQGVLRMDFKHDAVISFDFVDNKIDTPAMEIFRIINKINTTDKKDPRYYFGQRFEDTTKLDDIKASMNYEAGSYNGDNKAEVSGNEYYYNAYVRNYAHIITGYFARSDDPNNDYYGPDKSADDTGELERNIKDVDPEAKVFWYSTEII